MGKTPSVSGVFVWPIESGKRLNSDVFSEEKQAQKAIFREVLGDASPKKNKKLKKEKKKNKLKGIKKWNKK